MKLRRCYRILSLWKYTYQREDMEISHSWWILWGNKVNGSQKARHMQRTRLFRRFSPFGWYTLSHSKPEKRNDCNLRPTLTHTFTYQSPTSTDADAKHSHKPDQVLYKYPHFLNGDRWNWFITDPFNISNRERFIEFISPERSKGRTKKIKPPYSIHWQSLTTDVGLVEQKSRFIDVRHVNGYLIIPGIVYLLSTKLQKAVLNDRLGDKLEMNLIHYITRFGYGMRRGPHVTLHGAYSR